MISSFIHAGHFFTRCKSEAVLSTPLGRGDVPRASIPEGAITDLAPSRHRSLIETPSAFQKPAVQLGFKRTIKKWLIPQSTSSITDDKGQKLQSRNLVLNRAQHWA